MKPEKKINRKNLHSNRGILPELIKEPKGGYKNFSPKQHDRYEEEQEQVNATKRVRRLGI